MTPSTGTNPPDQKPSDQKLAVALAELDAHERELVGFLLARYDEQQEGPESTRLVMARARRHRLAGSALVYIGLAGMLLALAAEAWLLAGVAVCVLVLARALLRSSVFLTRSGP